MAENVIGKGALVLDVNGTSLTAGLKKAETQTKGFAERVDKTLSESGKKLSTGLGAGLQAAGDSLGGFLGNIASGFANPLAMIGGLIGGLIGKITSLFAGKKVDPQLEKSILDAQKAAEFALRTIGKNAAEVEYLRAREALLAEQRAGASRQRIRELHGIAIATFRVREAEERARRAEELRGGMRQTLSSISNEAISAREGREGAERNTLVNQLIEAGAGANEFRTQLELLQTAQRARTAGELARDVRSLTDSFRDQANTIGMTTEEASIYRLQLRGASEEQLMMARQHSQLLNRERERLKLMEEGRALTQQLRSPQEVFNDRQDELNRMLERGAINMTTYRRASVQALEGVARAAQQTQLKLPEAQLAGSKGAVETLVRTRLMNDPSNSRENQLLRLAQDQRDTQRATLEANRDIVRILRDRREEVI